MTSSHLRQWGLWVVAGLAIIMTVVFDSMVPVLLLFAAVAWGVGGLALYSRREAQRQASLIGQAQTADASPTYRRAPGEPVEVKGTLRCEEPLTSEMAERSCAYYHSEIARVSRVEEAEPDDTGPVLQRREATIHTETVALDQRFVPFSVEDASGVVGVHLEGAEIDAQEVVNRLESHTEREGPVVSFAGETMQLGGGRNTIGYRYTEHILPVDAPVYVLGVTREDGEIGASALPVDTPPRLLKVGKGELSGLPSSGDQERRFIVSHRSEETLGRDMGKGASLMGVVAIGAFALGTVLAVISLAVVLF